MGMVNTEITLINARDDGNAKDGLIKTDAVRSVTVTAVADTGSLSQEVAGAHGDEVQIYCL